MAARVAATLAVAVPSFTKLLVALVIEETALFLKATTLRVALTISRLTPWVFLAALISPPDMLSRRFRIVLITLFAIVSPLRQQFSNALSHSKTHELHRLLIIPSPRPLQKSDLRRTGCRQGV